MALTSNIVDPMDTVLPIPVILNTVYKLPKETVVNPTIGTLVIIPTIEI